jgi:glutamyl endopeptidase
MGIPERRRFETELADLEVILPDRTEDPVTAAETLAVPYRWICRLTVPSEDPFDRSYGMGTGILIGPQHVLTAAHVLVSEKDPRRTVGKRLRVQPARNGSAARFKEVGILGWQVHPHAYARAGNRRFLQPQHDYGLVTLDTKVSDWSLGPCPLGYWGLPGACGDEARIGMEPAQVVGQEARVTGYPSDKPTATLWSGRGPITWDARRGVLLHTADTVGGHSGSPIWLIRDGHCQLVGVHSGRSGRWRVDADGTTTLTHNAGALLSAAVVAQLRQWMRTFRR